MRHAHAVIPSFANFNFSCGKWDVNTPDGTGATPLHLACADCRRGLEQDQFETIVALLRLGADPLAKNADGATPLEVLAALGNAASSPGALASVKVLSLVAERSAAGAAVTVGAMNAAMAESNTFMMDLLGDRAQPAPPLPPCPLAAHLSAKRAEGRLTDATLVCEGHEIPVHSLALAAHSAFFEALLLGQFQR